MPEPFTIATIHLPSSGKIGIAPLPGGSGALAADLAVIRHWQARHLVSMTEDTELQRLGANALDCALALHGIRWWHFPIVDFGTPGAEAAEQWAGISGNLHAALDAGENVLLHCMGGKGRSGMMALRLLIERGEDPAQALVRIRAVRPGAVETEAQRAWAASGQSG